MTTDLKYYFSSISDYDIFSGVGSLQNKIKSGYDGGMFYAAGKLINLTLTANDKYLLSSGAVFNNNYDKLPLSIGTNWYDAGIIKSKRENFSLLDGVVLWSVKTGEPLYKLPGNSAKTFATISPDDKYVVSGDENTWGFVWNLNAGKKVFDLTYLFGGDGDDKSLLLPPKDFVQLGIGVRSDSVVSMKFIDNSHYFRFTWGTPYVILYDVHNPSPIKYLPLGNNPMVAMNAYVQDEAIDTAPEKHVLVMAQAGDNGGIVEYKYDPKTQTLKRIWVGYLKSKFGRWLDSFGSW